MTAIPAYDASTLLTASGQTHTGGGGAGMGFLVGHKIAAATNFTTATWGGVAMTNIHNYAPGRSLCVWQIVGDVQGAQTIAWTGSPNFDKIYALTLTKASKLSGSWVDVNNNSVGAFDVTLAPNYRQLCIAWYVASSATSFTVTATGTGNSLRYSLASGTTQTAAVTDADTAASNVLTLTASGGTPGWSGTGILIDPPLAGNQVIWF